MCARLVKKIWCDYIIDCSCYSEENKNRHNFLCATAWITIVAKSDVWIAITFSLFMQMPRFTYHFNSFNLLFKAIPNLVQNIAFEKNIPVPSRVLTKPNDSAAKGAIHPSGPKFINSWLWKHYKLSPHSDCNKWGLCVVYQKAGDITWVSHVDGSTTRMKKHLLEAHNMYVPNVHAERTHIVFYRFYDCVSADHAVNIHLSAVKSQRNPLHLTRNIQKMQPVLPHLDKVLAHSLALD